tara:strand:+ start:760 stop:2799 length:2040 start_codon:yes stop_codon:yes gene_type:complete
MSRCINKRKNKDEKLFVNTNVLTRSQLNELFKRDKFEYHIHLDRIPFHLLEEKNILEKLSNQVMYYPDLIKRLSKRCKSDNSNREIFIKLLSSNYGIQGMSYMPAKLRDDPDFIETILKICKKKKISSGWTYEYSSKYVKNNKGIALLAIETNASPDDLPKKFKSDLDIFKAYIRRARMNKGKLNLYHIKEFNIKKTHLNDELVKLLKEEPSLYKHLIYSNKCIKKNALISIYGDINAYEFLPKKLKKNIQILNYILSRNPDIVFKNLVFEDYKNINFSKLNLSTKVREYILKKFTSELNRKTTDIFEIAKYRANILNTPKENVKANPINNWHFSKPKVLEAIKKISIEPSHWQRTSGKKLLENISYELRRDNDILCHLASSASLTIEDFSSSKLSKRSLAHINKHLFIKRKYRRVSTHHSLLKGRIRKYVTDRIIHCSHNDNYFSGDLIGELTHKEKKHYIKKYPSLIKNLYHQDLCKYMKCLNKNQINNFIKKHQNIGHCKYYMQEIFGDFYRKNLTLAKSVIRDWPNEQTCSVIDFNYFIHHDGEFKKFLKNYNRVTIHSGDLRGLPAALRNNKLFIKNALSGSLSHRGSHKLFKELSSSFKTDPEITDWVLAIRPQYAKHLSVAELKKLDTKNLHPIARKVIYKKYLKKSKTNDVLENALIKQKLLQVNPNNKAA